MPWEHAKIIPTITPLKIFAHITKLFCMNHENSCVRLWPYHELPQMIGMF